MSTRQEAPPRARMEALSEALSESDAGRRRRPSERWPALYPLAVWVHRARRRWQWVTGGTRWAAERDDSPLGHRVKRHNSLLRRTAVDADARLQENKVVNLQLASARVDGLLIRPGETFSFNKVVGNCTRRKGYVEGMRLSNGEARAGVGGGLCQLANLVHWMVLHSGLTVTERSEHSFDPFADNGRVLPWGTGCSIVYNYVDLQVRNDTDTTFQLLVRVGERYLEGELRADRESPVTYHVYADDEHFYRLGDECFRANQIRRTVVDRRTGGQVGDELLRRNCALVKYVPSGVALVDLEPRGGEDPRTHLNALA